MDCEGFLFKLSPKSLLGVTRWQKRYFVLVGEELKYYKDKQKKKLSGAIPLLDVVDVRVHLTQKTRFDIVVSGESPRVFALKAESFNQLVLWSESVALAVQSAVATKEATTTKTDSFGTDSKILGSSDFLKGCGRSDELPASSSPRRERTTGSGSAGSISRRRSIISVTANSKGVCYKVHLSPFQNRILGLALRETTSLEAALKHDSTEDAASPSFESAGTRIYSSRSPIVSPMADADDAEDEDGPEAGVTDDAAAEVAETAGGDTVLGIGHAGTLPFSLERIGGDAKLIEALTDYIIDRASEKGHKVGKDDMPKPMKRMRKCPLDKCPVIHCTKSREEGLLYCCKHADEYNPPAQPGGVSLSLADEEEDRITLFDCFYETPLEEKIDLISTLFKGEDGLAQAMAIRLLWVIFECTESLQLFGAKFSSPLTASASDETAKNLLCTTRFKPSKVALERTVVERMASFVRINCTERNCVSILRDAFMSIACPKSFEMSFGCKDLARVSTTKTHFAMWKALMVFTEKCPSDLRREILEDINFYILEDESTKEWLAFNRGWQKWLMPLLEVPDEVTFKLSANLFVILHYHCFTDKRSLKFGTILRESLHASPTDDIARALLVTFATKLMGSKVYFPSSLDDSIWDNLLEFLDIVKDFIFCSCITKEDLASSGDLAKDKFSLSLDIDQDEDESKETELTLEDFMVEASSAPKGRSREVSARGSFSKSRDSSVKGENVFHVRVCGKGIPQDKMLVEKVLLLLKAINIEDFSWKGRKTLNPREDQVLNGIRNAVEEYKDICLLMEMLFRRACPLNNEEIKQITKFAKAKSQKERRKILASVGI